jgi:hypothetical protein
MPLASTVLRLVSQWADRLPERLGVIQTRQMVAEHGKSAMLTDHLPC